MSVIQSDSVLNVARQSTTAAPTKNDKLDQEDFFKLLSKQLAYQDPFKPVDNAQMVAQMASFTTAEGISQMSKKFETLNGLMSSSQALQSAGLVNQEVLIPEPQGYLESGRALNGVVSLDQPSTNVQLRVTNDQGILVATQELGKGDGNLRFSWDGKDDHGNPLPDGKYNYSATALVEGQSREVPVLGYQKVASVTLGNGEFETQLNLTGLGAVKLADVLEVSPGNPT